MLSGMNGTKEERNKIKMKLPEKIYRLIKEDDYETDNIGMSLASVQIYKDKVLKIQAAAARLKMNIKCCSIYMENFLYPKYMHMKYQTASLIC